MYKVILNFNKFQVTEVKFAPIKAENLLMLKIKKNGLQSGSQRPSEDFTNKLADHQINDNSINFKFLFLPFLVFLFALGVFKYFSEATDANSNRVPASISEVEPISVPTALKTILKLTSSDFDKFTTAKVKKDLEAGSLPQFLQKSSPVIIEKLKSGEMKFYSFRVFDSIDDDGDEVEILVDGQTYAYFVLSQTEMKLSIPIEFGESKVLTFKAIRDSGDGISFGAKIQNSDFLLDNIQVGESDTVYLGYNK